MKRTLIFAFLLTGKFALAQNTFPSSGNVGIGTSNPTENLEIVGNVKWTGYNFGSPRALKIGYSGGNYGGIGYNVEFTGTTGIFNRPLNDQSSYLDFHYGGFRFFGAGDGVATNGVNLNGSGSNLRLQAQISREGNFGIGTDYPTSKLSVFGGDLFVDGGAGSGRVTIEPGGTVNKIHSTTTGFAQYSNLSILPNGGNVGIGTTTIDNAQDWNKVLQLHGANHSKLLVTENSGVKVGIFSHVGNNGRIGTESNHNLTLMAGYWNDVMTLTTQGNVGVGTLTPQEKLSVNGKICAQEIKVENTNWPDYVFQKDYQLPSLAETEKHIKEKGHLPGIPSAEEVRMNGVNVGEISAKLLEKIEELMLHQIEQQKEILSLKQEIKALKNRK